MSLLSCKSTSKSSYSDKLGKFYISGKINYWNGEKHLFHVRNHEHLGLLKSRPQVVKVDGGVVGDEKHSGPGTPWEKLVLYYVFEGAHTDI
jgi:hypothetical protein